MDDSRRRAEIEDRLAEMEHGLSGLLARNDRSVQYLSQELATLVDECRTHRIAWTRLNERAEALLADVKAACRNAPARDAGL